MKAEDRVLFAAARQDFREEHRAAVEELLPVDWEEIAAVAESHGVAPIVGANLKLESLEHAFFENVLIKAQEAERLAQGIARLREAGYQVMLLKGLALDLLVYREPWVTTSKVRPRASETVSSANGSRLPPSREVVRRTPLAIAFSLPLAGVMSVRTRSASPRSKRESTMASVV